MPSLDYPDDWRDAPARFVNVLPVDEEKLHEESIGCRCFPDYEMGVASDGVGYFLIKHKRLSDAKRRK
jgi:hypothetical protein